MRYKVYPLEYDPMIASGSVPNDWTPEDTKKHQAMKKEAKIFEGNRPPIDRWYEILESGGNHEARRTD